MKHAHTLPTERPLIDDLIRLEVPEQVEKGDRVYELVRFGIGPEHVKMNVYTVEQVVRQACQLRRVGKQSDKRATITRHFRDLFVERPKLEAQNLPLNQPFAGMRKLAIVNNTQTTAQTNGKPAELPPSAEPAGAQAGTRTHEDFSAWLDMGKRLVSDIERDATALATQRQHVVDDLDECVDAHQHRIEAIQAEIEKLKAEVTSVQAERERDKALFKSRLDVLDQRMVDVGRRRAAIERVLKNASTEG